MNELIVLIAFIVIIAALLVDRYLLTEQHRKEKDKLLEELSRATKAVISKNANEYVMTTSIDKVPIEEKPEPDFDEVPEEALSDEEFMKAVQKGNKDS